jgi:hypothetical protein
LPPEHYAAPAMDGRVEALFSSCRCEGRTVFAYGLLCSNAAWLAIFIDLLRYGHPRIMAVLSRVKYSQNQNADQFVYRLVQPMPET